MSKACSNCGSIFDDDYSFVGVMGNLYCQPCHSSHVSGSLNQQIQINNDWWRMHFAGLAMQGMCARHANCDHPDVIPKITSSAFAIADAMIEESKKVSHD